MESKENNKIKYEVIGWTSFANRNYESFESKDYNDGRAARLAVIEDIRKNAYAFGGDSHQYAKGCTPVLNNGKAYRFSMRGWGALMAEAWKTPNDDGYGYLIWFIDDYRKQERPEKVQTLKYPKSKVDRRKILNSDVIFDTTVPEKYEPYVTGPKDFEDYINMIKETAEELERARDTNNLQSSGKFASLRYMTEMTLNDKPFRQICSGVKTVEIRLNDEKRQKLRVGDAIRFCRKNNTDECTFTEVVDIRKYSTFLEMFSSESLSKTGFDGYTVDSAAKEMYDYYDEKNEKKYGVLAIEIRVLNNNI